MNSAMNLKSRPKVIEAALERLRQESSPAPCSVTPTFYYAFCY